MKAQSESRIGPLYRRESSELSKEASALLEFRTAADS